MYPIVRLLKEHVRARRLPALPLSGVHVSYHICWPWDLDPWIELNNGRTLTLYDLGRVPMTDRMGLRDVLKAQGWALVVAGNTTRYRRRIRMFDRIEMRSRLLGWDRRFFYVEQGMWTGGDCANNMLARKAVTSAEGIVPPARVIAAAGLDAESPALPHWVEAWIVAEGERPWPPAIPDA